MTTNQTQPKYRAVSGKVYAGSNWRKPGDEFGLIDWPMESMGDIEPVNDEAKRVVEYQQRHRHDRGFPTPLTRLDRTIFLPANPGYRGIDAPPVEANPTPGMPRYRLRRSLKLGGVPHQAGAEVAFLGWPFHHSLEPINDVASEIYEYNRRFNDRDDLPSSPWCCYVAGPRLPRLEPNELAGEPLQHERRPIPRQSRPSRGAARRIAI